MKTHHLLTLLAGALLLGASPLLAQNSSPGGFAPDPFDTRFDGVGNAIPVAEPHPFSPAGTGAEPPDPFAVPGMNSAVNAGGGETPAVLPRNIELTAILRAYEKVQTKIYEVLTEIYDAELQLCLQPEPGTQSVEQRNQAELAREKFKKLTQWRNSLRNEITESVARANEKAKPKAAPSQPKVQKFPDADGTAAPGFH